MLLSDFHYFTFLILGRVFASSVWPFVVAISNPVAAAKAHLSLMTFTDELVSMLSEDKDHVLLLDPCEGIWIVHSQ